MNLSNFLKVCILGMVIALFVVVLAKDNNINVDVPDAQVIEVPVLGGDGYNQMNASCTQSVISVSIVATGTNAVLAENYASSYRRIQNVGNTMVSCIFDGTSSLAVGKGIVLYSSSSVNSIYEIDGDNLYQKVINCISQTSTGTISAIECY